MTAALSGAGAEQRWVAFLRNLNQGQRASPSSDVLRRAFDEAGARDIRLVRGNGTVIFATAEPQVVLARATGMLRDTSPWRDTGFVRSVDWLEQISGEVEEPSADRVELTLFAEDARVEHPLPYRTKRCTVVSAGAGFAVVVNDARGTSDGTPTIERLTGAPATSRSLGTIYAAIARGSADASAGSA